MWYQVDEDALDDRRIKLLGKRLGIGHAEAFLAMNRAWRMVYRQAAEGRGLVLDPDALDAEVQLDGFSSQLLAVDLAEATPDGIRCKGDERALKLASTHEAQSNRAKKGWETRRGTDGHESPLHCPGNAPAKPDEAKCSELHREDARAMPRQSPGIADLRRSSPTEKTHRNSGSGSLFPSEPPDPDLDTSGSSNARRAAGSAQPQAQRAVTDHWERRYRERAGRAPTWLDRHFVNLARLLKKHGAQVVGEAIDVLFDSPPAFLARSTPDFDTLIQHFDKLAGPAGARASPDPEHVARAKRLAALAGIGGPK